MWITLLSSDGVSFDVNASGWKSMSSTELPGLLDDTSALFHDGLVHKTDRGLQFNVSTNVLRPLVDALQRIFMSTLLRAGRQVRALPAPPTVDADVYESFWMLCELMKLMPYFSHVCNQCKPRHPAAITKSVLCPKHA